MVRPFNCNFDAFLMGHFLHKLYHLIYQHWIYPSSLSNFFINSRFVSTLKRSCRYRPSV